MTFTSVYANDMREFALPDSFLNNRIDVGLPCSFEIDGNRHMELELVNSVASVLGNVVFERAGTFCVEFILIGNWLIRFMNNAILRFDARFTIEYLSTLTIQHKNNILKITLIEKHLPIEGMQIWGTFAEFREILIPNTKEIESTFFY